MYPGITPSLTLTVLLTSAAVWTSTLTGCPKHAKFKPETSALESLECRNDYSTHIHCSWMGDTHIPLYLFHMDPDDHRVSPCIQTPNPSKNPAGQKRVSCHYNTSLFAIGFDDVFFFNTPHSPGLSKTFRLTKYDDAESHWIFTQLDDTPPLSHSTPGHLMTLLTTDPLRRHDQHRPEVVINQETLKGKREVKIHTNPVQKLEMEGSANKMEETEVLFNGPALTSDYSLPGPSNLHCVLNGGWNVSCSWEMTHDLAQYICYTLTYRTHSSALSEWFCVEKVEVINVGDLLRMVGVLTVFEPGLLQVQLTPTPVSRVIRAYENIQPTCPMGLSVELREDWILKWTLPKYRTVPLTAELKYWSILTPEDVKTIFLSDAIMVYAISERTLRGSTEYWAQVRCNVSTHRRSGRRYAGYPSEWTNLVHWTTRPEPLAPRVVAFFLYFLIVTLAAAVSITVFFILVTIQRRLREWDVSLPSPLHSKASEVPLCLQRERLPCCTEFKDPDISDAQIVGVRLQFPSMLVNPLPQVWA
ncbi:cytokine receptor common subunit beta-like isoform X2 [Myxocyprinus asiaticus]|uniref:cytokine receptor common subunit beta-like isoform X2 n=1 Tax=Myxocyprinus asiaticus TaxID=70543 RepID=UPI002222DE20|nr:cytokine receptor common subunit beta-like isoform X2 [Myxocyprinus asiaticus]